MAKIACNTQRVMDDHVYEVLGKILSDSDASEFTIVSAFASLGGVSLIEEYLHEGKVTAYIGIRNGATSYQAIEKLFEKQVRTFLVDTGTLNLLFHSKFYIAAGDHRATILFGSTNLTTGGLLNNIESNLLIECDLSNESDAEILKSITSNIGQLLSLYPDNVVEVKSIDQAKQLLHENRLIDESVATRASTRAHTKSEGRETVPIINQVKTLERSASVSRTRPVKYMKNSTFNQSDDWILMWESNELTRRDLVIPDTEASSTTHATGSMLLKKGKLDDSYDFQRYFRENLFSSLIWKRSGNLENSSAYFELVIKGISYGVFELGLTHNANEGTETWKQKNGTTSLKWKEARELISREDLLGHYLSIYRARSDDKKFLISIE